MEANKKLIPIILIYIIILNFSTKINSQKFAYEGDANLFVCLSDSLSNNFEKDYFEIHKIDTLIELYYYYDNGRYEKEIQAYIWQINGIQQIKVFKGCDKVIETEISKLKTDIFFIPYFDNKLFELEHELNSSWSHEFGYSFSIIQNSFNKTGYIRDSRRGINNFFKEKKD